MSNSHSVAFQKEVETDTNARPHLASARARRLPGSVGPARGEDLGPGFLSNRVGGALVVADQALTGADPHALIVLIVGAEGLVTADGAVLQVEALRVVLRVVGLVKFCCSLGAAGSFLRTDAQQQGSGADAGMGVGVLGLLPGPVGVLGAEAPQGYVVVQG